MARNLINRYVWLMDTIRRYRSITLKQLDKEWRLSELSDRRPLPRRTFYNYREAIAQIFGVEILCDKSTYEYYLAEYDDTNREKIREMFLDTAMLNELITTSGDVANKIIVEQVPSARKHLATIINALRGNHIIRFSYKAYTTSIAKEVVLEPYFVKIFKQRWYIVGRNNTDSKVKTYALDRIVDINLTADTFEPDPTINAKTYFEYAFGLIVEKGPIYKVSIQTTPRQAKYWRDLPLHHSQAEFIHEAYSIFQYNMRISPDLLRELMSLGSEIKILEPKVLREQLREELIKALNQYS